MTDAPKENAKSPSLWIGAAAGFMASLLGAAGAYLYLFVQTALKTGGDLGTTFLAAVTYIPLMLIFVFFIPNAIIGVLAGLSLAVISKLRGALPRLPLGPLLGVVFSHLILHELLPRYLTHQAGENDITVLISPLPFVAVYGALLGALIWMVFRKMS